MVYTKEQENALRVEWMYPPQMSLVVEESWFKKKLASLKANEVGRHARTVCTQQYEQYTQRPDPKEESMAGLDEDGRTVVQHRKSIQTFYERMTHFHFYESEEQQDIFLAYYFDQVSKMLTMAGASKAKIALIVRATVPPLMLWTNMGLATTFAYAARLPNGHLVMGELLFAPDVFDDVIDAAHPTEKPRLQQIRVGVNFNAPTTLHFKTRRCAESDSMRSCYTVTSSMPVITTSSAECIAAARGNTFVMQFLAEYCQARGVAPGMNGMNALQVRAVAQHIYDNMAAADPKRKMDPNFTTRINSAASILQKMQLSMPPEELMSPAAGPVSPYRSGHVQEYSNPLYGGGSSSSSSAPAMHSPSPAYSGSSGSGDFDDTLGIVVADYNNMQISFERPPPPPVEPGYGRSHYGGGGGGGSGGSGSSPSSRSSSSSSSRHPRTSAPADDRRSSSSSSSRSRRPPPDYVPSSSSGAAPYSNDSDYY